MCAVQTDGFSTTITFTSSEISSGVLIVDLMEEKEVTPPGIDGGGPNDTTSMRNTTWRTNYPKVLKTLTSAPVTISYDPAVFDEMNNMINDNQEITITFPDDSTLVFWGWINNFAPNANVEGEQPTAVITIEPSNMDADNAEIDPVYSA